MEFNDKMKELEKLKELRVDGNPFFSEKEQDKFKGIVVKDELLE